MIRIKNTLTGCLENFEPLEGKKVKMYVCGITPYDKSHLGHARTLIAFDIIRRYLKFREYFVIYVQNVTDIDDKIINKAKELGKLPLEVAEFFNNQSEKEFEILGIQKPDFSPKVSQFIPQIIELIEKIMQNGYAYKTSSGIYFDVSKFKNYGELSKQSIEQIKAGARIEIDEEKKNPQDFALWKFSEEKGATFDSPFGKGRPGWHIECSAMSTSILGQTIDIHGGARDLIFPHHENEIAQSESAYGRKFVKYWMHTGFLTVNGEKMAKSLGNFITIEDALKKFSPQQIRMFFALTHYASPIDFSEQAILAAGNALENLHSAIFAANYPLPASGSGELIEQANLAERKFIEYMDNDFDTPNAFAVLFNFAKKLKTACSESSCSKMEALHAKATLEKLLSIFNLSPKNVQIDSKRIEELIKERDKARKAKDFKKADEIRSMLEKEGILLEDRKDGTTAWRVK